MLMDYDCIELERRLVIGFNDHLSLAQRRRYIVEGAKVEDLMKADPKFKPYIRESRDVIHWLSCSREHSIIWYGDFCFPDFKPLRAHLPYMLFCRGEKPKTENLIASIVGTRHPSYQAMHQAFRLGYESSLNAIGVISGFAEGIDQSAMKGAMAGPGQCIGVLACGQNVEYPSMTNALKNRIVDCGGCVLSRFAPNEPSYKSNFISRNMIISAYSCFTIAVQAPKSSGTLNTCDYTTQMGKELYVATSGVGESFSQRGTTALFVSGAQVIEAVSDIGFTIGDKLIRVVDVGDIGDFEADEDGKARFGDRLYMATN